MRNLFLTALGAIAALNFPLELRAADPARPNILLVMVDDMGWGDLGCQGGEISTPNIDQLAATGVRFRQFYNSARCSPTRAALLTGLYTQQVADNPGDSLPTLRLDNNATIAEILRANGYRTYHAGKWHLGAGARLPENRGFQHTFRFANGTAHSANNWDQGAYSVVSQNNEIPFRNYAANGQQFYQTTAIGDYTLDFIDHDLARGDAPFFIYMAFGSPHFPLQSTPARADAYKSTYEKGWDVLRQERYDRQLALGVIDRRYPLSPRGGTTETIPAWNTLAADRKADLVRRMSLYAAMLQQVDENVGRVVARLRQAGQLDNTLILFLSDNGGNYEGGTFGEAGNARSGAALANMGQPGANDDIHYGTGWANLSNTPLRLFKHFTHEGGIRTPLIAHWPAGFTAQNAWREAPGHIIDVVPTILAAAGVTYPTTFNGHPVLPEEGRNLLPEIRGDAAPDRSLFVEHESNRMIRRGNWKLVSKNFALFDGSSPANQRELYDMSLDPGESHNVAGENPTRVLQLVDEWNAWATRALVPADRLFSLPPVSSSPTPMATDLFVDTFDRPDSNDIDASLTGAFGGLAAQFSPGATWFEGYEGSGTADSIHIGDSILYLKSGFGMGENGLNHNFVEPAILAAGGFSVSLKILEINTDANDLANRYAGFAVGLNAAQAAAGADISDNTGKTIRGRADRKGTADCFVELDLNKNVKVWVHGAIVATVPVNAIKGTLTATYATAGFNTTDPVKVAVYFDGRLLDLDPASAAKTISFKWDEANQNYLALSARGTNYVTGDNFAVRKLPLAETLAQEYAARSGLREANAAPSANVDHDQLDNLHEWAFGSNPNLSDDFVAGATLAFQDFASEGFRFAHRAVVDPEAAGVNYHYYVSDDLKKWNEVTPTVVSGTPLANSPGYQAVELRLPDIAVAGKDRLFLKVDATP